MPISGRLWTEEGYNMYAGHAPEHPSPNNIAQRIVQLK
jgi:hypothetical protein